MEESFPITIHPGLLPDEAAQVVFFDIETTGFSGQSAFIYLIGCIYHKEGTWKLRQWFLDDIRTEKELLLSFFSFICSYTWLIHFNGAAFDIPFIEKRLARHQISRSFSFFETLDLYKEIKPYRKALGLEGMKQKNLEEFLGIHREDSYTGGELIDVYYSYMDTHKKELLDCLLLHNADDLRGMLSILPLHGLALLLRGSFEIIDCREEPGQIADRDICQTACSHLHFTLSCSLPLPEELTVSLEYAELVLESSMISIYVPITEETLKYFYKNYKDYYYLPAEDMAIHKSVAAFVDKAYRKAATQAVCYTKRHSKYLPLKDSTFTEAVFLRKYKDKACFMELTDAFMTEKELQKKYLLQLL